MPAPKADDRYAGFSVRNFFTSCSSAFARDNLLYIAVFPLSDIYRGPAMPRIAREI